jgi:hypothetical protein
MELAMRKPTQSESMRRRASPSANLDAVIEVVEPCCGDTAVLSADDSVVFHLHQWEQQVRDKLMADPRLKFTSLVVRRVRSGLCLEGVLESDGSDVEVSQRVRQICGVTELLDRLVVHRAHQLPRKG